jgi:hypothetical protein
MSLLAKQNSSKNGKFKFNRTANVAELVDALDLGSSGATRESSSLSFRTKVIGKQHLPQAI